MRLVQAWAGQRTAIAYVCALCFLSSTPFVWDSSHSRVGHMIRLSLNFQAVRHWSVPRLAVAHSEDSAARQAQLVGKWTLLSGVNSVRDCVG